MTICASAKPQPSVGFKLDDHPLNESLYDLAFYLYAPLVSNTPIKTIYLAVLYEEELSLPLNEAELS